MTETRSRALIWAIHRTSAWWTYVGRHLGYDHVQVLTDKRGDGDLSLTDDFCAAYRAFRRSGATESAHLTQAELADVIARCRVLRWQTPAKATAMALAMADATERALDTVRPEVLISFPIDSYVSDILSRRARARGVPHFEVTASALPDMTMLMWRGKLITSEVAPSAEAIAARIAEIADPRFTPAYVQGQPAYTQARFIKTLAYFRLRAAVFQGLAWATRDPLNLHYLDAQPSLGHKARFSDARIAGMVEPDWETKLAAFPEDRRVLFGLQLFPEAAIDYWLEDLDLVRHEDMLVEIAGRLTQAGYQIVVKDHPLQFGFRQTALLERLKQHPNVVIVPYDVSGNAMLARCGVNVTATGTLGLQSALLGNVSVTGEAYYVTDGDFVVMKDWRDLARLSDAIDAAQAPDLTARQTRIIDRLLRGSFDADFFSFKGFDPAAPNPAAAELGRRLGARIRALGPEGENWHGRHYPAGSGRHDGSPLN